MSSNGCVAHHHVFMGLAVVCDFGISKVILTISEYMHARCFPLFGLIHLKAIN